jgi:hypothetical protein
MIRARFYSAFKDNGGDYRPITFPPPHPYWCSGESDTHHIIVAYADNEDQIRVYWPEAVDIDSEEVDEYLFTSRFPKPEWFNA